MIVNSGYMLVNMLVNTLVNTLIKILVKTLMHNYEHHIMDPIAKREAASTSMPMVFRLTYFRE